MNSPENGKIFIFNAEIDSENLQALYGDDYTYIEEVFGTVLNEYGQLSDNILSCYAAKNITALKAAVHKIKPIFGFVGLTRIQQQCQQFEHVCQESSDIDTIERDYGTLKEVLIRSKAVIEEEKKKLELFNRDNA